jgi:hypothetical protein
VFTHSSLQCDRNIECSTCGHGATNTRHGDNSNILNLHVSSGLGYENQALVQEVQKTFVGFDRAFDSAVSVVAIAGSQHGSGELGTISMTDLTKSFDGMMTFLPDRPRKILVTT